MREAEENIKFKMEIDVLVPDPSKHDYRSTKIMPHMIVIMANPFIQIINIYFLVFFILRDPAKAERDLLQFIPFDIFR